MQLWKTHARRIAALVCTLAMMACLLPSAAFATGAEPAAQPAAAQGETVDNATDTAKDTPQNTPENNAGDKTASAATDSTEDKAASTATDSTGDKTASAATDNVGNKAASTATDNAGDKTGDTTEDTTGTQGGPDGAPVATALNSLAAAPEAKQARKTEGDGAEIWFYIAKPGNTTLPGNSDDYYFLTRGGSASQKAESIARDSFVTNVGDEAAITSYATAFPTQLLQGWLSGASVQIQSGSWTIDPNTGVISEFDLVLDSSGEHYTSQDYTLRWVKFSNAQATPDFGDQYRHTYHMDAMLFKNVTVNEMLAWLEPEKILMQGVYNENAQLVTNGTFTFTISSTDHQDVNIQLQADCPSLGRFAIRLQNPDDGDIKLVPGSYTIQENQSKEDLQKYNEANTITFDVNRDGTFTLTGEKKQTITNTPREYSVSYEGNGEGATNLPTDSRKYRYNQIATISTDEPTRAGYWFKGWNTQPDGSGTPYEGGQQTQIQGDVTLYAQWEPMYNFTLQPANMTIYVGGSGDAYGGIVDGKGNSGKGDSSLPEPGFYFTLPDTVNAELNRALGEDDPKAAVDLSQYVTVTADDGTHNWTLEPYGSEGEGGSSTAKLGEDGQERFVYRIVPDAGQEPIRVQIKNGDTVVTSDKFEPSKALYAEYTVSLYTGTLKPEDIVMTITVDQADSPSLEFRCQYDAQGSKNGTLTVRHASEDAPTTPAAVGEDALADKIEQDPHSFHVQVEDTQTFYLNETDHDTQDGGITVAHDDVSLLADTLVSGDNYEFLTALDEKAQTKAGFTNAVVDRAYLDLVDASNGNAWLTAEGKVKVFWPYRNGMNQNSTLKLYHFEGLDRNMTTENLLGQIAQTEATPVPFTQNEHGITFETDSFSPFVLVCDTTPAPQPSTGGGSSDTGSSQSSTVTVTATAPTPTPAPAAKPAAAVVIPQTGDEMPVGLLAGLAVVAAGGLAALLVLRKRRGDR